MSVTLRKRKNHDGSTTLLLDVYHGGKRKCEFLTHLKLPAGNSPADRQIRKENLDLAKRIALARGQELQANDYNVATDQAKKVLVVEWMRAYAKKYDKADIRVVNGVIKKFEAFLAEKKLSNLTMKNFTEQIALAFRDRLKRDCKGEGAKSAYNRFKKVVRQAYRENLLSKNPCEFVPSPRGEAAIRDILTPEELQLLANTPTEATEVKRGYLFTCMTGARYCDVRTLRWFQVNIPERTIKLRQSKTGKEVILHLNDTALAMLGERGEDIDLVFNLGSANGCNKSLQAMVDRAEIKKKIRWHSGRHFCGSELTRAGANLVTVMQVLGQSSLGMAKRYVQICQDTTKVAVNSLPAIHFPAKMQ